MEKIGRFFAALKEKKKLWLLAGGALLGILLLLWGGGARKTAEASVSDAEEAVAQLAAYGEATERELELLCEAVEGVSDVRVMVTFSGGFRRVYAVDGAGNTLFFGTGSDRRALDSTLIPPTVGGVGIVCRGGDRPEIEKALTDLVSTVLNVPANRVSVKGK